MGSPYFPKDIERLEKAQASATKMIPALRNYSTLIKHFWKSWKFNLEVQGHLIEVFSILKEINIVNYIFS